MRVFGMLSLFESPWLYRFGLPFFHIAALAGLATVRPNSTVITIGVLFYVFRGFGITVGYHRYFTHEAFKTSRPVAFLLALLGGLAGQRSLSWWVSRHRTHHRYTDREGDPHSPRMNGFFHAHFGWLFADSTPETLKREEELRAEWPRELQVLDRFLPLLFLVQGFLFYALGGWVLVTWAYFVPTILSWHLTFFVNSLCHIWGARPFDTQDDSRNNYVFAAIMFGEGWHNNHHAWPKNARLGLTPFQFDLGFYFIKLLKLFGLVWDVNEKTEEDIRSSVRRYSREGLQENSA